jgi:putative ABC transport system permease protein
MRRLWLKLFRRRRLHEDMESELAFHRAMSIDNKNPIPLGNTHAIKEQSIDLWRFNFIENLWRDLLYAARGLRRNPALVVTALISLGLGIGVNTAMFSLGMEFLFSEPSVRDSGSLGYVRFAGNSHSTDKVVNFVRDSGLFEDVVGMNEEVLANFNDGVETHRVFTVATTKNYFTTLGVPVLYGRGIIPSDPDQVAVLHYRFWRKYFNGDPSVIGQAINIDGRLCTVVGILPEHHRTLVGYGFSPDISLPRYRDETQLAIYARIKPGMARPQALAGLRTVATRMDAEMPSPDKFATNTTLTPVAGYARLAAQNDTAIFAGFFAMLLAVVSLVLLIACVNVASLLLARLSARRREIATRLALGSSRGRLMQQFLAESLLLSLLGAALGFALADAVAVLLAHVHLPFPVPIVLDVRPDWRVALYGTLITIGAALMCGLLPAWQSVKESFTADLHREGRFRLRSALVAVQIATSVVVLTTGLLFLRNLAEAGAISPGFDVHHTLRADLTLPLSASPDPLRKMAYVEQITRALSALPGIETVAAARDLPFSDNSNYGVKLTFADNNQQVMSRFVFNAVAPEYFRAMDIPLLEGRTFAASDRTERPIIVNRTFALRYLGGRPAVGTVVSWDLGSANWHRIVGVSEGTKTMTIGEEQKPQVYELLNRLESNRYRVQFVLRSTLPPATQLEAVRRTLHRILPAAGADVETMYSSIGFAFLPSQIGAILLGSLGVLGLLLAGAGLYGVMVYSVARRTREIGVRMAIGATRNDISRMVLRDTARLTLSGCAIGLVIAFFVTKPLALFLIAGLKPGDPLNFAAVTFIMLLTGLAAAWGPMRRAVSVDPNVALRDE